MGKINVGGGKPIELTGNALAGNVLLGKTFYNIDPETKVTGTLSLTGNASASDVLAGKTFYNTNPTSKITGTLVSGKQFASGGPTPDIVNASNVTIDGLPFTPTSVICRCVAIYTSYSSDESNSYMAGRVASGYSDTSGGNNFFAGGNGIVINPDGFNVKKQAFYYSGASFRVEGWVAYE